MLWGCGFGVHFRGWGTGMLGLRESSLGVLLKDTTGGGFRVYRACIKLLEGIKTFYNAPTTLGRRLQVRGQRPFTLRDAWGVGGRISEVRGIL